MRGAWELENPVVLEHKDVLGELGGKPVKASTLNSSAILLTSLGADQILVPVPGSNERERVAEALQQVPTTRRNRIRLIDEDGKILSRVRDYLMPIGKQASKWPEDTFVTFALNALYNLALGCKYGASVACYDLTHMMEFIPIIDPGLFHGEARYRLAELALIASRYNPSLVGGTEVVGQVSEANIRGLFWKIIESSEYSTVVNLSGKLGLVRKPDVLLRRMERAIESLVKREDFKLAIRAAETAAELANLPVPLSKVAELAVDGLKRGNRFAPPFIEIPITTDYQIAMASLAESFPDAVPPKGAIYATEATLNNASYLEWLNDGEEAKLSYRPQETLEHLRRSADRSRIAATNIVRGYRK